MFPFDLLLRTTPCSAERRPRKLSAAQVREVAKAEVGEARGFGTVFACAVCRIFGFTFFGGTFLDIFVAFDGFHYVHLLRHDLPSRRI